MNFSEWMAVLMLVGLMFAVAQTAMTNRTQQDDEGEEFRYMSVRFLLAPLIFLSRVCEWPLCRSLHLSLSQSLPHRVLSSSSFPSLSR